MEKKICSYRPDNEYVYAAIVNIRFLVCPQGILQQG